MKVAAFLLLVGLGIKVAQVFGADAGVGAAATGQYVGIGKCTLCHSRSEARTEETQPGDELISTDFVSLTEVPKWAKDKHANAYAVLNKGLGFDILKTLGITNRDPSCLGCHGPAPNPRPGPDLSLGVTCEACHGPGGGWLLPHAEPSWRTKSTSEKQQLGMIDLRNAAVKVKQCMSCHIGNPAEKRVVTHEMYAAGHPPLPSVEIEQYVSRMPAHWKNLGEKKPEIRSLLRYDANEKYRTKSVLLGAVLAYREWLNVLTSVSPAKSQGSWTDFAVYDCYGCHHDLPDAKTISWRQRRGYGGIPGRPHLAEWPPVLVKAAIFYTSGGNSAAYNKTAKEFSVKADRVSRAYNSRAFGPQKTSTAASERDAATSDVLAWLDRLAGEIYGSRVDNAATVRLMQMLAGIDGQDRLDYSSARQIGGALASLFQEAQFSGAKRQEIGVVISELKSTIGLEAKDMVLVNKWQAAAAYDPQRFNNQLARLAQLLK